MLGAGGRGWGIVLPLTPSLGKKRVPPVTTTLDRVYAGEPGWLKLDLFYDGTGVGFGSNGQRLPIKLHRKIVAAAGRLVAHGEASKLVVTGGAGTGFVADTFGIHKGSEPKTKDRLLLQFEWQQHDWGFGSDTVPAEELEQL